MLNFIKAELWKVSRRMSFYVVMGFLLLCAHLFGLLFVGDSFHQLVSGICGTMFAGLVAVPMLVELVDKSFGETLRNESSFGISREESYLGKLFSILLVGLALCAVLIGGVLLSGYVFLSHDSAQKELVALVVLAYCLAAALPVWCGMAGLCHMLAAIFRSEAVWTSLYYLSLTFLDPIIVAVVVTATGIYLDPSQPRLLYNILLPWSLLVTENMSGHLTLSFLLQCWAVGLGWLGGTTAVGLMVLRRRRLR